MCIVILTESYLVGLNFGCHKIHCFKPELVLQVEQTTYVELLMLVLDFQINFKLNNTQWHFCGIHGIF